MSSRANFLAERRLGIGGSDIASLFNQGYGCRRRLWFDKRNVEPDYPFVTNRAMELGNLLEPFFAEKYAEETRRGVMPPGSKVHEDFPFLRVNADRLVWESQGPRGVLEIKAQGRAVFYKTKRDGLPIDYSLQVQHGMLVHGLEWGAFCIGNRDSGDIMHWDVKADTELHREIIDAGAIFWAQVENGPMPDALEPDDRRCGECAYRLTCHGNALVMPDKADDYEQDESLAPLVQEYVERNALVKEAKDLLEETKAELQFRLGERGMVAAAGAKIQFYKIHKKEYVVKAHDERPLRIYPRKEKG